MGHDSVIGRLIPAIFIFLLPALSAAAPESLSVCETCHFHRLADAIAQAAPHSTILVGAGDYPEHAIIVDKPLRILARDPQAPRIDGQGAGTVIFVNADDVEISGLQITGSGVAYTDDRAGIKVMNSSRCRITGNILNKNQFGIYLGQSHDCVVSGNEIHGLNKAESTSGNGIHVWNCDGMTLENNLLTENRDGLYFEFTKNSLIRANKSFNNLRYGLHFMYSNNNEYRGNLFKDNGSGVAVMYSKAIRMFGNRFEGSRGGASYGILLKEIAESQVAGNRFVGNTYGVYLEGTTRSQFESNTFSRNGWALRILGDCDSNQINGNDFVGNTFDVSTNTTSNQNRFSHNYWSRYRGLDLNRDGFGDDPYFPVQLSTLLMERFGASVLLINSFFFRILDEMEEVLPALTPEAFKDPQPSMIRRTRDD